MAGKTLEEYFVSLGIKGQNVVLKNIKDIKKQADALTKNKSVLNFGKGIAGIIAGLTGKTGSPAPTPEQKNEEKNQKKQDKNTRQFSEGSKKFGNAVLGFTRGAESFDPVGIAKNMITAAGESFSNITVLGFGVGNLPKGLAELTNTMVSMASGAIDMAKTSAATQYGLSNRNATTRHYGGEGIGQGGMSRAQHSELVMTIAGSFGRIQKPLQETVNKLVESKNTEALARVAGGNWASTGTDKGWFLQQIANETQGLPPSIAQAIQNSLLKSNAGEIQDKGEEKGAQAVNADWVNLQEDQNRAIYKTTSAQHGKMMSLSEDINSMQIQMINTGVKFAGAISDATDAIKKLPEKIEKMNKAFDSMAEKIYKYSFREIDIRRVSK
jgi:hypothetical protein